jgi:two-component system, NtrC family, sensor histidine kinase PilS
VTGFELRRRLTQLMLFRVVLITFVLGATVVLYAASPDEAAATNSVWLFGIVGVTYLMTLVYALWLRRVRSPMHFANLQFAGDLVITTLLVHLTGGAQSGYTFFYLLTVVGAALIHYRTGAVWAVSVSLFLYVGISLLGWWQIVPVPAGQRLLPWDLPASALIRQLALNGAAFVAVGFLAAKLGAQLASAGASLETQQLRSADLAAQSADVIRCLSSGLVTIAGDGRVSAFNEAAAEIMGVTARAAIGKPIEQLAPEIAELLERAAGRSGLRREVISVRRGRDERVLGVSVSPLTNHRDQPVGHIVNFTDLTDLRRMEEQVQRAERLAAVGQMAAGVAHEIRNPLASISGSIELLRSTPQLDPESGALMGIVLREVDRLNGLITELLEYARPRERVLTPIDLAVVIEETLRVFAQDRNYAHVTTQLRAGVRELVVHADPAQVRQVVWNLLRNAADAMPQGGAVEVSLGLDEPAGMAEFAVEDHGKGMSQAEQERLFEPFFSTKTHGTGLGLATVHRIVSEHGGHILVDSEIGRGTRMTIRLPYTGRA